VAAHASSRSTLKRLRRCGLGGSGRPRSACASARPMSTPASYSRKPMGDPIHPDTVSQLMPRLTAAASVPAARLHDLRHLHATTLLLAGVPVHVVAAHLGHSDPAITLRVYAHVIREASTAVADVFAKAVSDAPR
jgi:integrase